jgi:signal recognition particle subunit SRP54
MMKSFGMGPKKAKKGKKGKKGGRTTPKGGLPKGMPKLPAGGVPGLPDPGAGEFKLPGL